ncbi:MAG: SUMF1/EgtB/PvdO family nonheme iron enzyme, partial [Chloroflexi bacterium]|nr:SUMF1/EgtB/PvdO family nonheme iron enzyme [Chloroflexota bacterium]
MAQAFLRHGTITAIEGDTVFVQMESGLIVDPDMTGYVLTVETGVELTPPPKTADIRVVRMGTPTTVSSDRGVIMVRSLNMRVRPGGEVVRSLPRGSVVDVLDQGTDWYTVRHDGDMGVVSSQYVSVVSDTVATGGNRAGIIMARALNVRESPDGTVVHSLSRGTVLAVLDEVDGWMSITSGTFSGYVSAEHVDVLETRQTSGMPSGDVVCVVERRFSEFEPGQSYRVLFDAVEQGVNPGSTLVGEAGVAPAGPLNTGVASPSGLESERPYVFYLRKGVALYEIGDYESSIRYLEKSLRDYPDDPFVVDMLSKSKERLANSASLARSGVTASGDGATGDSDQIAAWKLAAQYYIDHGEYDDARPYLETLLDKVPNDQDVAVWLHKGTGPALEAVSESRRIIRLGDGQGIELTAVTGGSFQMGDTFDEGDDEKPVRSVDISDFWMGVYEINNGQFAAFLNARGDLTPSYAPWVDLENEASLIEKRDGSYFPKEGYERHPMVNVTWHGAAAFAGWVGGRLPTEAEWEYAARNGGQNLRYTTGDTLTHHEANFRQRGSAFTGSAFQPTGTFQPSPLGLHDMAGNVWEWCMDWYHPDSYESGDETDPRGPDFGENRVLRGGSWFDNRSVCRAAYRNWNNPEASRVNIGFRIVVPYQDTTPASDS